MWNYGEENIEAWAEVGQGHHPVKIFIDQTCRKEGQIVLKVLYNGFMKWGEISGFNATPTFSVFQSTIEGFGYEIKKKYCRRRAWSIVLVIGLRMHCLLSDRFLSSSDDNKKAKKSNPVS